MTNYNFQEYFSTLSFWQHLKEADREFLLSHVQEAHYHSGEAIHTGELRCLGPLFVRSGILRVYLLSDEGKEATIARIHPDEVCVLSASCILSSITFDAQIDAETDCHLLVIPSSAFAELMRRNIYVENFIYHIITEHFSDVITAVERMFFLSLRQRISAFLIDESARQETSCLALTQEQLARAIGSAREAVSRNLKPLVQDQILEITRGEIRILDKNKLYQELS